MFFKQKIHFIEFYCYKEKNYINRIYVCDKKIDCFFGEDEENCTENSYQFNCLSTDQTISYLKVCNFIIDCEDGSDEDYCS